MYGIVRSAKAKKSLRRHEKRGSFPLAKFREAMMYLRDGKPLPLSFHDHQLKGDLLVYREFHLAYHLLVQYRRNEALRIITITEVGTHTELFGR